MPEGSRRSLALIVLPYAVFAALWIVLSDWLLNLLVSDPRSMGQLQTYKGLAFVSITALLLYFLVRRQQQRRDAVESERDRLRRRLLSMIESITDGFVALDRDWRYLYVNTRAAEMFGRRPQDLIGKHIWTEFPEGKGQPFHRAYERAVAEQTTVFLEDYYPPRDRWFENRIYPTPDGLTILFQDITERKRTEAQLQRMNRLYNTLSETNQAIVRATDSTSLFQQICDIAVKFGGFRLAWIGLPEGGWLRVAAAAGPARGYVEGIRVSVRADLPEGQGPSGRTFRTGEHFICDDFSKNPATAPWHEHASRFGIAGSAVFALREGGRIIGVLNIYAGEPNYFQEAEVRLLDEMAVDISFALDNLERQKALRESQQELEAIVENLPLMIFAKDAEYLRLVRLNRAGEELLGMSRSEMLGKNDHDLFPPEQAEFFIAKDRETLAKGETVDILEEPIDTPRGRRLLHTRKVVLRNPGGQPRYLLGISEDITERRKAEAALQQSEHRLRDLIDGLGPQMFVGLLTLDGVIVEANRSALAAAGLKPEDVQGKPVEETYWWNYSEEIQQQLREAVVRAAHGETSRYDVQIRVAENQYITLDFFLQPLRDATGKIVFLIPSAIVITERKRAEQALRESEERLRLALDAAHMGTFDWDVPHNRITWSRWHEELWGFKPGEFGGTYESFSERVHSEDLSGINAEIARCIAAREPFVGEFRVVWPDGSTRWISGRGEFTFDSDGRPLRMRGAVLEITARKRAEQALQEREEVLRIFVTRSPAAIGMFDHEMRYVAVSLRWLSDYGLGDRDIIGHSHYEIFPEMPQRWKDIHRRCLAGATERNDEDPFLRADGRTDWVKWEICPWRKADGGIGGIIIFSELITERKQAEEKLREYAHQLEILSRRLLTAQEEERRRIARELHDQAGQALTALKITLQMPATATRRAESLALADEVLAQVRALSFDLRPSLLDDLGLAAALRAHAERLCKRAKLTLRLDLADFETRPEGEVETACFRIAQEALTNVVRHSGAAAVTLTLQREGDAVLLKVSDDGRGFDPARIADASLGLLGMRERAELVGGRLEIESAPGRGTTVRARLPWRAREG